MNIVVELEQSKFSVEDNITKEVYYTRKRTKVTNHSTIFALLPFYNFRLRTFTSRGYILSFDIGLFVLSFLSDATTSFLLWRTSLTYSSSFLLFFILILSTLLYLNNS